MRSGTVVRAGSKRTVADSEARFTFASSTPSTFVRNRVIRFTHDAQVIPSTGKDTISKGSLGVVIGAMILPGGIRVEPRRSTYDRPFASKSEARRTRDSGEKTRN